MAREQLPADAQLEFNDKGEQQIRYGTSLWRLQDAIDNQPMDQEATEFYAGDVRDICNLCDASDKTVKALKDKAKGVTPGTVINLNIADVRALIKTARSPKPETPAT